MALEEIARSTKVNINYLRAIERGEFDSLPGGIYTISYIRQYARAIEFDEQELLRACGYRSPEPFSDDPAAPLLGRRPTFGTTLRRLGGFLSGAHAR